MNFTYTINKNIDKININITSSCGISYEMSMAYHTSFRAYNSKSNSIDLTCAKGFELEWDKNWHINSILDEDSCLISEISSNPDKNKIYFKIIPNSGYGTLFTIDKTEENMNNINALINGIVCEINE
jgi:hypothetical protein